MSLVQEICDGLVLDLQSNVTLPPYNLVRYRRPRGLNPEYGNHNVLGVWFEGSMPVFETTGDPLNPQVAGRDIYQIGFWMPSVHEAATLQEDERLYVELLDAIEAINERVIYLGMADLVTEYGDVARAWQVLPAGISAQHQEGVMEGYSVAVAVMVNRP